MSFHERSCQTIQTTALIHEAYLRLIDAHQVRVENRRNFFAVAARLMRQMLVDLARERHSRKRGGGARQVSLNEALVVSKQRDEGLLALDEALSGLAQIDPRKSQMVELRFFGGLSVEEAAREPVRLRVRERALFAVARRGSAATAHGGWLS